VLVAGPSGAGKSTLLRALAGVLLTADVGELSGEISVGGAPAGSAAGQAGLLLQDPVDARVSTRVGRDVAFGPENRSLPRSEIWARVADSLAAVGFPYDVSHPVHQLSGGEGQRLALAGALALRPGLMLLDEPTSMLDPTAADAVRRAVLDVAHATGSTLVVVEHRLAPWVDDIDRVIVLSAVGAIMADGRPDVVFGDHGDLLAAQGVWVPGRPSPEPARLEDHLARPWLDAAGDGPEAGALLLDATEAAVDQRLMPTDVAVRSGETAFLTGASGSGKSTLLAALAGLQPTTGGRVAATPALAGGHGPDPRRWRSADLAPRIGWVGQHPDRGFVARTVREEVLAGVGGDGRGSRADALIEALGLAGLTGADPHRLSGGEQRRLAVAAALAQGPRVLLLDEPTLGQDRNTWAVVAGAIVAARSAGTAVVVATHDEALLAQLPGPASRLDLSAPGRRIPGAGADTQRAPVTASAPGRRIRRPGADTRGGGVPAARCGPLAVMLVSLLAVVGSVFVRSWPVGLVALGVQLALAPLATRGVSNTLRRLLPGTVAALSIGWSSWLLGGHDLSVGVTAGLRILVLVLPGALLTQHLDPSRLGDDLAQRLRLPARPVVATVAALQRVEDLGRAWVEGAWARRTRGLGAGRSPLARIREAAALTFALLVQSLRQAGRMAVAMDARGFAGAKRRTWAEPSQWQVADTVLVAVGLALAALPAILDVTWM
jgi:energy-coupling factor transport system permease/ATP-binding protein